MREWGEMEGTEIAWGRMGPHGKEWREMEWAGAEWAERTGWKIKDGMVWMDGLG